MREMKVGENRIRRAQDWILALPSLVEYTDAPDTAQCVLIDPDQNIDSVARTWNLRTASEIDRIHLMVDPSGESIRFGRDVLCARDMLAYVDELQKITDRLSVNGSLILHMPPACGIPVDQRLIDCLASVANVNVESWHRVTPAPMWKRRSSSPAHDSRGGCPIESSSRVSATQDVATGVAAIQVLPGRRVLNSDARIDSQMPRVAKAGICLEFAVEVIPDRCSDSLWFDVPGNQDLLGIGLESHREPNDPRLSPVLVDQSRTSGEAIPLNLMLGEGDGSVGLARSLGVEVVCVRSANRLRIHLLGLGTLAAEHSSALSEWCCLLYTQVQRGRIQISPGVANGKRMAPSYRPTPTEPPTELSTDHDSWRIDSAVGRVMPPRMKTHRSQASFPRNYREVLKAKYLNRQPRKRDDVLLG